VSNPRDEIDSWLEREVTPLMPPPGSLDRIRHRARRRKRTQAIMAAAGCAVVIAGAAAVPQLTGLDHHSGQAPPPVAAAQTAPSARSGSITTTPSAQASSAGPLPSTSTPGRSRLSSASSGVGPPADFRPTSVTFAGTGSGSVVGAVIGQAGDASHPCATIYCTSLAGTSTYGTSWYGVSAPLTGGPDGSTGVSQLRFVNLSDGWAYGPALWETSQGGWPWQQENTYGLRVTDLETSGQRAFAVFARCGGSGADYASDCTSFSLWTSVAGSSSWAMVAVPQQFLQMNTSTASAATLVISGGKIAYLLAPSGAVASGPAAGGSWTLAGRAPCQPGAAQADGQPASAQLAAGPSLVLACDAGGKSVIYTSSDGGSWKRTGAVQTSGTATSVASAAAGQVVLATTGGIYYSRDAGASWHAASVAAAAPGGFSYVGMTNATQGVAVPVDAELSEVFVTSDSGKTWTASPINS
jgi:hypothetical protein